MLEKLSWIHLTGLVALVLIMWKWMEEMDAILEEKSSFKVLGLTLSSKLDWGSYIISIPKTATKKIGTLICSMEFLSP